ncbi:phage virion morphogenesis protein [Silvimonas sp.]|uniref:phage virion morphogenesis protein n=1 Tax=Silvimonas sp. TaxID=2650811 RepID=UPI002851D5D5|nr:phage virion morphogenesis protein [Silvimonas sp.]MDR3429022.1 phage virion morphogenesis protein [Silvimonas sp.]
MANNPELLSAWLSALAIKLQPASRRALARKLGQQLRKCQTLRIASQKNADGSDYRPRVNREKNHKNSEGRIKRTGKMFVKLRTARHLRLEATSEGLAVGYGGNVARIARVHQYGLRDRISRNGPDYVYPQRELLGFGSLEREALQAKMLEWLISTL